jgi:hypothetical protein
MTEPSFADCSYAARYEICLLGRLDDQWLEWFGGVQAIRRQKENQPNLTVLICIVPDQAKLRGILNQLWDLNLTLISVKILPGKAPEV